MDQKVYIVEAPTLAPDVSFIRQLTPQAGFRCIRSTWATLPLDELTTASALLVAMGVPDPAAAIDGLRNLAGSSAKVLTLAVLPMNSDEELVRQTRSVADDLMFWPVREWELHQRLKWLAWSTTHVEQVRKKLTQEFAFKQMVGAAPSFSRVLDLIARFGPTEAPVLLTGETGTGKELCARLIHALSRRHNGPLIAVECGAVPEHLAESELFGHVRGAFTDAHRDHKGLTSLAEGGTLFLDEIDALSLTTQGKLLRFIQEGTYRPLGAERVTRANVRLVAATNCDLERMVSAKQFRSDLYFRLNVLRLPLPPLRERRSDIKLLAEHFLEQVAGSEGTPVKTLASASLRKLETYDWPGNVRELLNVLQRAVVLAPGSEILPEHIALSTAPEPSQEQSSDSFRAARSQAIECFERHYVAEMLQKHHGNITHAARDAGHDRRGFGRLAKKFHLDAKHDTPA